ncbi:MAG TPA: hypothetical protein VK002_09450 [Rubricoccaceae bacterium]|nr:hypothetical protein [Rubricoccaceae bacterium]
MDFATPLLRRALDQARTDWLAGDPAAWSRYADCLARLERYLGAPRERRAAPTLRRPRRPGLRPPRGLA